MRPFRNPSAPQTLCRIRWFGGQLGLLKDQFRLVLGLSRLIDRGPLEDGVQLYPFLVPHDCIDEGLLCRGFHLHPHDVDLVT
jgi:hypothetical protein